MKTIKRFFAAILVLSLTIALIAGLGMSVAAVNQAVQDASKGVLQINMVYTDENNTSEVFSYGSCFLINSDTIVTCAHCVDFMESDWEILANQKGKSVAEFKSRVSYSVTVTRDVTIPATLNNVSLEMDWAVLTLAHPLQDHAPLTLRSSATVELTENVYAVGFPALISYAEDINTYTSDDVTITNGQVNKISYGENIFSHKNYDFIQTSCKLTSGNSGGPLVDENGYVIGVCEGAWGTLFTDDYYTSVAIDQVIVYLKAMGIEYVMAEDEPVAETTPTEEIGETQAQEVQTPASTQAPTMAVEPAPVETVAPEKEESGLSTTTLLLIIIAVIVVVAAVVIVIVLATRKKNTKASASASRVPVGAAPVPSQQPAAPYQQPVAPFHQPAPPRAPFAQSQTSGGGETTVLSGSGETTVLDSGAGETSVLSMAPLCKLIREKGNETIAISKADFSIGKERSRVDYCISDNNSISRMHARIVCKDGKFFIIDQNATNGTYVNNVRAQPRREVEIKNGDQIKLSDEVFTLKVE